MPLKKLTLKSGVNRENTTYYSEGGWYEGDKVRFRQGTPEKIGGWVRTSANTYSGVCRSLFSWATLVGRKYIGVGTHTKFYVEAGGAFNDITPVRVTNTLTNPFTTTAGSTTVQVADAAGGYVTGDEVVFYQATAVGGITVNGVYTIQSTTTGGFTITHSSAATSAATGGGAVVAMYSTNVGTPTVTSVVGWGGGRWGGGRWGRGQTSQGALRLWSQSNFGEDLLFAPRGGSIYYFDSTTTPQRLPFTATVATPTVITAVEYIEGTPIRFVPDAGATLPVGLNIGQIYYVRNPSGQSFNVSATPTGALIAVTGAGTGVSRVLPNGFKLSDFGSASNVPDVVNTVLVSDASRFIFAFGCTNFGSTSFDPMLVRWSDQENPYNWTPASTNQAGFLRLSKGSQIVTANQSRQEILVWTDTSLYSMQYVGAPIVWGSQLVGDNITIISPNAVAFANGVSYWMGADKFYKYDGRVQPMRCDVLRYVFRGLNQAQRDQVFAGTNNAYNEVWWFYPSTGSTVIDHYVVYNYLEDIWYYGSMNRTAWIDSGVYSKPIAATYSSNLVQHEVGVDDGELADLRPLPATVTSAQFDLDDGHNFMLVSRVLPDITFDNSTATAPSVVMQLLPSNTSGSGYVVDSAVDGNHSVALNSFATVGRTATVPVEQFTQQVYTRVRGRQMAVKISSTDLGVAWQLGAPRLDMKPDGKR